MTDKLSAFAPQRCVSYGLLQGERDAVTEDATTLFVDLAGFTPLTERLARFGSRGTEELSRLLRRFFGAVTDVVLDRGGDPVAYGGDALTIVFDGAVDSTRYAAVQSAETIQELARGTAGSATLAGELALQARIGIARGPVTTALARSARRSLPVHLGAGLDLAVAAEEEAAPGEVVVHPSVGAGRPASPQTGAARVASTAAVTDDLPEASRLVHPLVLARLGFGGALLESHRTVTVAFIRFPSLEQGELQSFLDLVAEMLDLADAAGGEVVQVSGGDKGMVAMLVFGAPVAHDDDALRAIETLLDIRRRRRTVGIGAATGPVFTALLGSERRRFAANSGPAVNLAARLMQAAGPGELLIEPVTWQASAAHLRTRGRPTHVHAKGVEDKVEVRSVTGWRRARSHRSSTATTPILGREAELRRIERFLDDLNEARGPALVLEGEPGVGKSRLARETAERARTRGARVLSLDAGDHPRGRPAGLWRDWLAGISEVPSTADRAAWGAALEHLFPDVTDQTPALGPLIGVRLPESRLTRDMPPDIKAEVAQTLFARAVRDAAHEQPLLIVLENGHCLDEAALGLVAYVARTRAEARTGMLLTRRRPSADTRDRLVGVAEKLTLRGLSREAAGLLAVDAWTEAGGGRAPDWLPALVSERTGGNPLFVRTVAQAAWSRWKPGEPPPTSSFASGSLAGALLERVDVVPTRGRQLLNLLAVAGRPLASDVAQTILPKEDGSPIQQTAQELADVDLVQVEVTGLSDRYQVRHDLLAQVVYEAMSHGERARLHRCLADELAARGADALEIAGHVAHLEDADAARHWFPLAAEAARASWALSEAIRWWQSSMPLLDGSRRAEATVELLELSLVAGRPREVIELGQRRDTDFVEPLLAARRLYAEAEAAFVLGDLDHSEEAVSRVIQLIGGVDEIRHQRASELLVRVRSERGDTKGALETAQAQLLRAEATGDSRSIATAHASLGLALVLADAPAEAAGHYEAARERAVALGDVVLEVHVVSDLAGCCHALGDYAGCLRLLAEARRAADKIGYRRHLVYNLTNEAQLRCTLGDEGAQACAAVAVQRSLELDDPGTASDALHTWLSARPGLAGSAAQHWARLVRLDTALGRYGAAAEGGAELALVLARGGHRDAACTAAADALSIAGDLDLPRVLRRSRLARLLAECPRRKSGGRAYGPAVLDGLVALAADDDADEIDRAELAMDRWRTTRTDADRESAVEALRAAFQSEPSLCVRAWFKELKEQPPPAPILLAPPIGIGRVRTTRAQLDDALWQVESAVFGKRQPRRAITRLREPEPEAVE